MLREHGWTLPLSLTLTVPLPDRPIRRALFIVGGNSYAAPQELAEVRSVLERIEDLHLIVLEGEALTAASFTKAYQSADFDLLWIASHGQFEHLHPEASFLYLNETEKVHFDDLRPGDIGQRRRLLVLNACDGATTASTGSIGEIGLAASAAHASQAVISHLWPIPSITVARVFAVRLAAALAQNMSFFDAYTATVSSLANRHEELRSLLQDTAPKVLQVACQSSRRT